MIFTGRKKTTEYEIISGAVIGLAMFIQARYPNDKIMHEKLRHLTDYVLRLGYLIGKDNYSAELFKTDMEKGRFG